VYYPCYIQLIKNSPIHYSFAGLIDSTFLLQQRIYRRRARRVYGLDIILYPIEVVVVVSSSCIQVVRAVWEKQIPR
jgi:hypothetical protein